MRSAFFERRKLIGAAAALPVAALAQPLTGTTGRTLRVGTAGDYSSLREASKAARDGDTIELSAGDYRGDSAVWSQRDLKIIGTGGMARLTAAGANAEGKGIFVVRCDTMRIENLAFIGARVPDRNGAGIRLERGRLNVANCHFEDNENGILTGNEASSELSVTGSTFIGNGSPDGSAHSIYAGLIRRVEVTGCYLAKGRVGHLLKSRASETTVRYSRLTGEEGTASYELEFPNGGNAVVVGNLIQQGPMSENFAIISFGAEGYRWPENLLQVAFNTIVNDRPQGAAFLRAQLGNASVRSSFNVFVGEGTIDAKCPMKRTGDVMAVRSEFADPGKFDFRFRQRSKLVGAAGMAAQFPSDLVLPTFEYRHPAAVHPLDRTSGLTPVSPGAFQTVAAG